MKAIFYIIIPKLQIINALFVMNVILLTLYCTESKGQNLVDRVVIDAGHGGKDPGASGTKSREKDIVLSIALKVGDLIEENKTNVEVIYTRKTDVFIPLNTRAEIANNNKADLFISIHCNSNPSSLPKGSETYVMGMHKSADNLKVAMLENSAILMEDDYKANYEGFDPSSTENLIIFNFFQNTFQAQNIEMATTLQSQFKKNSEVGDRGVKSAGFWVLFKTTMPGVLIELGFLSNASDQAYLISEKGQKEMAKAIFNAFIDYKKKHDSLELQKLGLNSLHIKKDTVSPKTNQDQVLYRIQFLSLSTDKKLAEKKYIQLPEIKNYFYKGMYRYTSGEISNFNEAINLQNQVRKMGFKDAFIVAFYKNERISLEEAKKISQQ